MEPQAHVFPGGPAQPYSPSSSHLWSNRLVEREGCNKDWTIFSELKLIPISIQLFTVLEIRQTCNATPLSFYFQGVCK